MKKIFILLTLTMLFVGFSYANDYAVEINGIEFHIPSEYQGGEIKNDEYELDNIFSIRCVDDNVAQAIGLWAEEHDFEENLNVGNHPVRHYCQYNRYVNGNHSHAYFASGDSIYEISWVGSEIDSEIGNLIKNTPKSKMNDDDFYKTLDESIDIYKEQKIDKLNEEGEYNYLEAKYSSLNQQPPDDARFKEILLTYY